MSWFEMWDGFDDECEKAPDLFARKPQTKADSLRGMTDSELAEMFGVELDCHACQRITKGCGDPPTTYAHCINHWLDWLREEVK